MRDREALEDAFDRAEGALETAFRQHQKALARFKPIHAELQVMKGREECMKLSALASKLSTTTRNGK